MLEAVHNARQQQSQNAELIARLKVSEEQIRQLREENLQLRPLVEQLKGEASRYCERTTLLEEEVRWLKAQMFGRSAEHRAAQLSPDQHLLFNEAEVLAAIEAADAAHAARTTPVAAHERPHTGGRKAIPKHFPRQEIIHELAEDEQVCPHDGTRLERFGEEVSERYGYQRPKIWVERHVRGQYGCPSCREGVKIAPLPPHILPKSMASPSLLAHLIANKFVDGIPLYRTCGQLERLGLELSPGTVGSWVNTVGDKMTPLVALMHEELLAAPFIHMDETYLQVLKSSKAPTTTHFMVVRAAGPPGRRIVLFNYEASRTVEALKNLLVGPNGPYQGKLLTDGLELYDSVTAALGIMHFGCLVHGRRYFDKAAKVSELPSGRSLARTAMVDHLQPVFRIERRISALREQCEKDGMPPPLAEILKIRQTESAPRMAAFKRWVDELLPGVPPKSALGKALSYTTNQWTKISRFLDHPEMPAENNYAENQVRPFAVGRRSWLFCHSAVGAMASANLFTLVMSCRANDIEPYAYLCYLLEEFPKTTTAEQLEALLPWNAKAAITAITLAARTGLAA